MAQFLNKHPEYKLFEMGQELRNILKTDSPFAKEIQEKYDSGFLMSDEQIIYAFTEAMSKFKPMPEKMIFDGIPRKIKQKEFFDKWMKDNGRDFKVININISMETAVERLLNRRICKPCNTVYGASHTSPTCDTCDGELTVRRDESHDAIEKRLSEFEAHTKDVLERYRGENNLIDINGEKDISIVQKELLEKLNLVK